MEVLDPDDTEGNTYATIGFGVANWHLVEGNAEAAREIIQRIVDGDPWNAFGYIAAETELARMAGM